MNQRAFLAVVLSAIIAGTGGIFVKSFTIPATSIAWIRTAFPSILIGGWMIFRGIPFFRGNYKRMLLASTLNTVRLYFFFIAYLYTSIGNAVILFYSWPIFATIYSAIILKEKVSSKQVAILMLAFVGIVIAYSDQTFSFENSDFIGMAAAISSAVVYPMTVILFKMETDNYHRNEILFYQNLMSVLFFLPFFFYINELPGIMDLSLGVGYATVIGIISFGLFFYGLKYLKASLASALMYIEVVSAIFLSYLWFEDVLSVNMIIGGSIILISSFFINRL